MVKVIIFDWGNVLGFFPSSTLTKIARVLDVDEELFRKVELENRLLHDLGRISTSAFVANICTVIKKELSVREYYALLKKYDSNKLNLDLLAHIKELKNNFKIFLLSNNSKPILEDLKENNLDSLFDKMLFSFQAGLKKPNAKFFSLLLENTPFSFSDCVMIDDREDVCVTAKELGMQAVVFQNNSQLKHDLSLLL